MESVQKPCIQNQKDLVENGVIESVIHILNSFRLEKHYFQKGIETEEQKQLLG